MHVRFVKALTLKCFEPIILNRLSAENSVIEITKKKLENGHRQTYVLFYFLI